MWQWQQCSCVPGLPHSDVVIHRLLLENASKATRSWTACARQPLPQDLLNDLFDRLSLREPEEAEAQARAILTGLGFTQAQQEGPLGQLSGEREAPAVPAALGVGPPSVLLLLLRTWERSNWLSLPRACRRRLAHPRLSGPSALPAARPAAAG